MKGNEKLIQTLNSLLTNELTAINQYMVHAEMCDNWGYARLHGMLEKRAIQEMKHAEKLIDRILFLEGRPIVSNLNDILIGSDIPKQFESDLGLEIKAVASYNAGIKLAMEVGDSTTKTLLEAILNDEDGHVDQIEENQDQIQQMGLAVYLTQQVKE